jgi:polyferredoxin
MSCGVHRAPRGAARPSPARLTLGLLFLCVPLLLAARQAFADLGMQVSKIPLWKAFDQPFFSLDGSHVELFALLFLFMATVVVMSVRRRRQLIRHLVQLTSMVVFFYIVFSCLGVFGMIRNTIHGIGLIGTVYTESFFWMSLPICVLAFSLTTGPFFCGWICPTGTIQELFSMGREVVTGKRPLRPNRLNLALIGLFFIGFLYLVLKVSEDRKLFVEDSSLYWAASIILIAFLVLSGLADDLPTRSLRWVSLISILLSSLFKTVITSPVHFAFVDVLDPASAVTTLILAVASLFIARGWCRYVCPWGMLMSLLHRYSRLKVRVTKECTSCGACATACRVGAVEPGLVRTEHCQFCFACVDACPQAGIEVVDEWAPRLAAPGKVGS